jgi:hypothetical protein
VGENGAVTPRAAGIAVLTASVVVGVLSALYLTSAAWGLIAAASLSVALAGGGLGMVWMSRTRWGAEPRPERHDLRDGKTPRRARRSALIYGIVLLVVAAAGVAAIGWTAATLSFRPDTIRIGFVTVVVTVLGISLVRFARSPISETSEVDDEAPSDADGADVDEWQRLTRRDWFVVVIYSIPGLLFVGWLLLQLVQFSTLLTENSIISVTIAVVLAFAVLVGVAWWMRRRFPEVWVNPVARRIRVGNREAGWNDLTAAKLSTASLSPGAPRTLFLTLEGEGGLRAPVTLRRRDRLALTSAQRDLAVRMITDSRVEMPRAAEDPDGRFSRFNYPEHVSRDDAIALILRPPRAGEDLPIPYV